MPFLNTFCRVFCCSRFPLFFFVVVVDLAHPSRCVLRLTHLPIVRVGWVGCCFWCVLVIFVPLFKTESFRVFYCLILFSFFFLTAHLAASSSFHPPADREGGVGGLVIPDILDMFLCLFFFFGEKKLSRLLSFSVCFIYLFIYFFFMLLTWCTCRGVFLT